MSPYHSHHHLPKTPPLPNPPKTAPPLPSPFSHSLTIDAFVCLSPSSASRTLEIAILLVMPDGMGPLVGMKCGSRIGRVAAAQEQISDERIMPAFHTKQDHLRQTTVLVERRAQRTVTEQSPTKAKDNGAYVAVETLAQAREQQDEKPP